MRRRTIGALGLAIILGVVLFVLETRAAYAAGEIHVKPVATGAGDGSSWANATTLQSALVTAATTPGADEIWVATGVYTPGLTAGDAFTLPAGVAVYGGFAGTETLRSQRDWRANLTILSGDIDNNDGKDANGVVTDTANITGTNSLHVVTADGTTTPITGTTVLDGFTITAGRANGVDFPDNVGGGFYCNGSRAGSICSPSLANLTFTGNTANVDGGALYNDGFRGVSSPSLVNVIFAGNTATGSGGAMFNDGIDGGVSNPSLVNVVLWNNQAALGGAMYNAGDGGLSSPSLVNVTIANNIATAQGGGMYNDGIGGGDSSPSLRNVILWGNTAAPNGGAQLFNNETSPIFINRSLVEGGFDGAGVVNVGGSTVTDGGGNLSSNPLFVNALTGDLRLQFASPAIDAGTNDPIDVIALTTDLDGAPRKVDGNFDGSAVVDMGAYEAQTHPLTVVIAGNGSVSRNPLGNDCTAPCSPIYVHGTPVTLTATAATGSTFTGWSGACNGTGACVVTMDGPKTVTATFTSHALTVTVTGSGSVSRDPAGSTCTAPCSATYPPETDVTLTPVPATGSTFVSWSGACTGAGACVVTMDGPKTVTAAFTQNPSFTSTPVLGGTVGVLYSYAVVAGDPDAGDTLTLSAPVKPGWLTLTDPANGTATLTGTPGAGNVGAHAVELRVEDQSGAFATQSFTITVTAGNAPPSFTSTPVLSGTVGVLYSYAVVAGDPNAGSILTFSAPVIPAWLALTDAGDGTATLTGAPGAGNVGANPVQLRVEDQAGAFATQSFTITVAPAPANTGSVQGTVVDDNDSVIAGAQVTLTAVSGVAAAATVPPQTTDATGLYFFDGVPAGVYSLTVSKAGFDLSAPVAVTVQAGETTNVAKVVLQPSDASIYLPGVAR